MVDNGAPQEPKSPKQNEGPDDEQQGDEVSSIQQNRLPDPTNNLPNTKRDVVLDKITLLIQGSLALFAFITLIFVWKQTDIFKSQLLNQSRAWVTVDVATYEGVEEGKSATAKIVFVNSGNTPALNVKVHNTMSFRSSPVSKETPLAPLDEVGSLSVIGPHSVQICFITQKGTLQADHIKDLKDGNVRLYVWGVLKYSDIFNNQRETRYCMVSKIGTNLFDACQDGNYAD